MSALSYCFRIFLAPMVLLGSAVLAAEHPLPSTANRPGHEASAAQDRTAAPPLPRAPSLPDGMTLDDVLDYAAQPPPRSFPEPLRDRPFNFFTLIDQLEYRVTGHDAPDQLGWSALGWLGGDFNRFWWKSEGEAVLDGPAEGESEQDFLYSRLITPFWFAQAGVQYANDWLEGDYHDRWSGALAFEGLAPYQFELDNSLYFSEDGDVTFQIEAEYDLRITQRLVLQPRLDLMLAAQDIPSRQLGAGLTSSKLGLRLRYEFKREFAPYVGLHYLALLGETRQIARASGEDPETLYFVAGLRFAF